MAPKEQEDWLATDDSKRVGADSGDGESVGHKSGLRIVEIKRTNKDDITDDQWDPMATVVGYTLSRLSGGSPALALRRLR